MKNGTALTTGQFARLAGTVIANLPREMEGDLALDYADNGEALAMILEESLTRENLNQKLAALGKKGPLLIPEGTVTVAPSNTPFVARDHFIVDATNNASVKIVELWDNFRNWFLGKTEQSFAGSTLRYGKLSRPSADGPIIAELGGETKAETTLAELFALMKGQPNGEVLSHGDGWRVGAISTMNSDAWYDDERVFSRNS